MRHLIKAFCLAAATLCGSSAGYALTILADGTQIATSSSGDISASYALGGTGTSVLFDINGFQTAPVAADTSDPTHGAGTVTLDLSSLQSPSASSTTQWHFSSSLGIAASFSSVSATFTTIGGIAGAPINVLQGAAVTLGATLPAQLVINYVLMPGTTWSQAGIDVRVTATPIPAPVLLLLAGVGGVGFAARRKQQVAGA